VLRGRSFVERDKTPPQTPPHRSDTYRGFVIVRSAHIRSMTHFLLCVFLAVYFWLQFIFGCDICFPAVDCDCILGCLLGRSRNPLKESHLHFEEWPEESRISVAVS
jgi:hypothetical protein